MDKFYLSSDQTEAESRQLLPDVDTTASDPPPMRSKHEPLGINPYTTLVERERHEQHLRSLEAELLRKEREAVEVREARAAAVRDQLNPRPQPSGQTEIAEESPILTHARKRNPLLPSGLVTRVDAKGSATVSAVGTGALMDPEFPFERVDPLTYGRIEALLHEAWPGEALATTGAPSSATATSDKAQKHRGYFGPKIAPRNFRDLLTAVQDDLHRDGETFVLDNTVTIDATILTVLFGTATVDLNKCAVRFSGAPEHRNLRCSLSGKPPHPWKNDKVTVDVMLSSFSYTTKSVVISAYMRAVPHLFAKLGLSIPMLWSFMPFNLRMATPEASDAVITAKYVGKSQLRVLQATTKLGILGNRVVTEAVATVSGFASSAAPSGTLRLTVVDDPSNLAAFRFKKISLLLAFLDSFPLSAVEFEMATHDRSFTIFAVWKTTNFNPVRRFLGDEENVPVEGRLSVDRVIRLATRRGRQHFLWSIFKLDDSIGFIETQDGVVKHGVECTLTATISRTDLRFVGRFEAVGEPPQPTLRFFAPMVGRWAKVYAFPFLSMFGVTMTIALESSDKLRPLEARMEGTLALGSLQLPANVVYDTSDLNKHMLIAQLKDVSFGDFAASMSLASGFAPLAAVERVMETLVFTDATFNFNPNFTTMVTGNCAYAPGFTISVTRATFAGYSISGGAFVMSKDGQTLLGRLDLDTPVNIGALSVVSAQPNARGPSLYVCYNVVANKTLVNSAPLPLVDDHDSALVRDGIRLVGSLSLFNNNELPCVAEISDQRITLDVTKARLGSLLVTLSISAPLNPLTPEAALAEGGSATIDRFNVAHIAGCVETLHNVMQTEFKALVGANEAAEAELLAALRNELVALSDWIKQAEAFIAAKQKRHAVVLDARRPVAEELQELRNITDGVLHRWMKKREKAVANTAAMEKFPLQVGALATELHTLDVQCAQRESGIAPLDSEIEAACADAEVGAGALAQQRIAAVKQRIRQTRLRLEATQRGLASLAASYRIGDRFAIRGTVSQKRAALTLVCSAALGDDLTLNPQFADIQVPLSSKSFVEEDFFDAAKEAATILRDRWCATLSPAPQYEDKRPAEEQL